MKCIVCDYEWCWDCGCQFEANHYALCKRSWEPEAPTVLKESKTMEVLRKDFRACYSNFVKFLMMPFGWLGFIFLIVFSLLLLPFFCTVCRNFRARHIFSLEYIKAHGIQMVKMTVKWLLYLGLMIFYFVKGCGQCMAAAYEKTQICVKRASAGRSRWITRDAERFGYPHIVGH